MEGEGLKICSPFNKFTEKNAIDGLLREVKGRIEERPSEWEAGEGSHASPTT